MQLHNKYVATWQAQLASAKHQLSNFDSGKVHWKVSGVDRSEVHVAALNHAIGGIQRSLEIYECRA